MYLEQPTFALYIKPAVLCCNVPGLHFQSSLYYDLSQNIFQSYKFHSLKYTTQGHHLNSISNFCGMFSMLKYTLSTGLQLPEYSVNNMLHRHEPYLQQAVPYGLGVQQARAPTSVWVKTLPRLHNHETAPQHTSQNTC